MCLGFALGNYVYLSNKTKLKEIVKSLSELIGVGEDLCSFMTYIVIGIILIVIIEPEKIKPIAFLLSAFVLGSGIRKCFN